MSSTSPSTFFRLPPELRNMVYELVIDKENNLARHVDFNTTQPDTLLQTPSLVQVCQQIRQEAYPMFLAQHYYDLRCVCADEIKNCEAWLNALGTYASEVEDLDVMFHVERSRLPKIIEPQERTMTIELFELRFSGYGKLDNVEEDLLTLPGNADVPRIKYKEPRDVNATDFEVQLIVTNQDEADGAMSHLLGPLGVGDDTLKQVSAIFNFFTDATVNFDNGEKILIDLWQYRQYREDEGI
ncbi:hypothetical protein MBLNU457_6389t2 [Dothideomycetes sp. NU457]